MRILSFLLMGALPLFAMAQPAQVNESALRAHLSFLADDLLEGRGTGQHGGELSVRYLETQAAVLGLQPLPGMQGYRQEVPITGSLTLPESEVRFMVNGKTLTPVRGAEIVYGAANGQESIDFSAPIVFVGYGVKAPEEHWDDYKGRDLKGKMLVMMVNDPQPTVEEPNRFGGKALTYYGRWTYKFEEAARQEAAGVLLIHTTASASYGWNVPQTSFSHERFSLVGGGNAFEGWLHEDAARALFAAAGQDLDRLRTQAERRDFQPVELVGATIHARVRSAVRKVIERNVIGMVPGVDTVLRQQAVIYSAHWDHLGMVEEVGKPRQIWNGAVDNASGSAALLAMAQAAAMKPARRTQIFMWTCAEEQNLLGSAYYTRHPLWPLSQTSADLNLDSMNFAAATSSVGVAGSERSSLLDSAKKTANAMGLRIAPDVPDLGGAYFRADHFSFARAGVPAFSVGSSVFSGDGQTDPKLLNYGKVYHTVRDRYDPDWRMDGMAQQAQFTLNLGYVIANDIRMAEWNKNDPYAEIKQ